MEYTSTVDNRKLELIDKIFSSVSIEYLQEIAESEEIISKLKGEIIAAGPIRILVNNNMELNSRLLQTENDLMLLRVDLQTLLRALNQQIFSIPFNNDFSALKNKHGIY